MNAWTAYEQIKEEKNLLDYADLNKRVLDWAAEGGEEELAKMFDYVIVDEFQDTNRQQFDLLKVLCGEQKKSRLSATLIRQFTHFAERMPIIWRHLKKSSMPKH